MTVVYYRANLHVNVIPDEISVVGRSLLFCLDQTSFRSMLQHGTQLDCDNDGAARLTLKTQTGLLYSSRFSLNTAAVRENEKDGRERKRREFCDCLE